MSIDLTNLIISDYAWDLKYFPCRKEVSLATEIGILNGRVPLPKILSLMTVLNAASVNFYTF